VRAEARLVTNKSIPNTDTGGQWVGQAVSNLGQALGSAGAKFAAQADDFRQKQIAFDNSVALRNYQVSTANVEQEAAVGAQTDGGGLTQAGIAAIQKHRADLEARVQQLAKQGDTEAAMRLNEQINTLDASKLVQVSRNQFAARKQYEGGHINDMTEGAAANATTDAAVNEQQIASVLDAIDNSTTLTEFEKYQAKRVLTDSVIGKEAALRADGDPVWAKQQMGMSLSADELSQQVLRQHEGLSLQPYDDGGTLRIGYGSDTVTTADGRILRVVPGMVINKADAERDLARRQRQFSDQAASQIGAPWNSLSDEAKAVATSLAYNYGRVPQSVIPAFQSGNPQAMAEAVRGLSANYNNPETAKGLTRRRMQEADLIMGAELVEKGQHQANVYDLRPFLTDDKPDSHAKFNQHFGPRLQDFLQDARAAGHDIRIFSGYRDPKHQERLWNDAVKKYGSPEAARRWVAPPGKSQHNHGNAADLRYGTDEAQAWAHANAEAYGLHFRMGHEPWHVEADPNAPRGNPRYADLTPQTQQKVMQAVQAEYTGRETERTQNAKAQHDAYKNNLDLRIQQAQLTDVNAIYSDWRLDEGEQAAYAVKVAKANEDRQVMSELQAAYNMGAPLPTGTKVQREMADKLVEQQTNGEFWSKPESTAQVVHRTHVVPKARQAEARAAVERGDPAKLNEYLPTLSFIYANSPGTLDGDGNGELVGAIEKYRALVGGGASQAEAVQAVAEAYHPDTKQKRKDVLELGEDFLKKNVSVEGLYAAKVLPSYTMSREPTGTEFINDRQQAAVMSSWDATLKQALWESQGDKDAALALAGRRMRRIFGETNVEGVRRMTAFPVEHNYPPLYAGNGESNHDYVYRQAVADVEALVGDIVKPGSVRIVPGRRTQSSIEAGDVVPRYQLMFQDKDTGLWEAAGDDSWHVNMEAANAASLALTQAEIDANLAEQTAPSVRNALRPRTIGRTISQDQRTFPASDLPNDPKYMENIRQSVPSLIPQGAQ